MFYLFFFNNKLNNICLNSEKQHPAVDFQRQRNHLLKEGSDPAVNIVTQTISCTRALEY